MKPGEYDLPKMQSWEIGCFPTSYRDEVIAAVEKAHAERNCGNCKHGKEAKTIFEDQDLCLFHHMEVSMFDLLKCNDWKPKEELTNADA